MSLAIALKKARSLVAGGWSGPGELEFFCRDSSGWICSPSDEGVATYGVLEAVKVAAGPELAGAGMGALELALAPNLVALDSFHAPVDPTVDDVRRFQLLCRAATGEQYLDQWLAHPDRKLPEVLSLFDRAVMRAKAQEAE